MEGQVVMAFPDRCEKLKEIIILTAKDLLIGRHV